MKLTNDIRQKYPTLPVVTMSMGALGVVSRMAGEIFGSCITFGAVGEISAPGQIGWSAGTYSADNPQGTGINKNIKIRGKL